jgi:gamma-glutamyl-gamma-aminobutyrate hydrolase PuuD
MVAMPREATETLARGNCTDRRERCMPKVKVGVAWRRDGNNVAHQGDLDVFTHPALKDLVDVYTLAWDGAAHGGVKTGELKDMDLLVIPGGPHSNDEQIPVIGKGKDNAPSQNAATYATERAKSELDLIEQARTVGMPILALCGGSWRLVQNYGGQTVEVAALDANGKFLQNGSNDAARKHHAANMNNVKTEFKHEASIRPGSLLQSATGLKGANPKISVNSVHWAVVRTGSMETRPGLGARPYAIVPNNMLEMSAKDTDPQQTVEGFESRHGAPVLGVQWHPEYQLPTTDGKQQPAQQKAARAANLALLQWMIKAGQAYRVHREAMTAILTNAGLTRTEMAELSQVSFKAAPVHLGEPGTPAKAGARLGEPGQPSKPAVIPKHKLDTEKAAPASLTEAAVRSYIFNLGRPTGKIFLQPMELYNLAVGAPLSRWREQDELKKGPVIAFMKANVWAQKYCSDTDKTILLKWPQT